MEQLTVWSHNLVAGKWVTICVPGMPYTYTTILSFNLDHDYMPNLTICWIVGQLLLFSHWFILQVLQRAKDEHCNRQFLQNWCLPDSLHFNRRLFNKHNNPIRVKNCFPRFWKYLLLVSKCLYCLISRSTYCFYHIIVEIPNQVFSFNLLTLS